MLLSLVLAAAAAGLFGSLDLPTSQQSMRFIVTGDAGATHSQLRAGMLRIQQQHSIDAVLLVGDNFYPCGIQSTIDPQWSKITEHFGPLHVPIYPILGNHDYGDPQTRGAELWTCGPTDPQAELDESGRIPEWHFPARNYTLHSPLVDIIMIDTQPIASGFGQPFRGSATASQERQFLEKELSGSHAIWRIVAGHHTIFSSGIHGRMNDSLRKNMRALLPMLRSRENGADLYICGHDHDLELIGDRTGHVRPLFLISGAGSGLDTMKRRAGSEPPTLFPSPLETFLGFAVLDVNLTALTITFYDKSGTQHGQPLTITRRAR